MVSVPIPVVPVPSLLRHAMKDSFSCNCDYVCNIHEGATV